jgi:hypothetical protein
MNWNFVFSVLIAMASLCSPVHACKIAINFDKSKKDIQNLLDVAGKVGAFEGYKILRIESDVGVGAETVIEISGQRVCKRLIFSALQPGCEIQYKFLREETCQAK